MDAGGRRVPKPDDRGEDGNERCAGVGTWICLGKEGNCVKINTVKIEAVALNNMENV